MSHPQIPQPAKLVVSLLLSDKLLSPEVICDLEQACGVIEWVGPWMAFDYTDYYAPEMGRTLHRRMLVFRQLIEQLDLVSVKQHTNAIEFKYSEAGRRRVNIDPGCLLYERFVLATGKNYSHRIHIGQGIYADLTLIFQQGAYRALPWTYPDYGDRAMTAFLMQVRRLYSAQVKSTKKQGVN
jgi:Domain of unknown function (DUF4416)